MQKPILCNARLKRPRGETEEIPVLPQLSEKTKGLAKQNPPMRK